MWDGGKVNAEEMAVFRGMRSRTGGVLIITIIIIIMIIILSDFENASNMFHARKREEI